MVGVFVSESVWSSSAEQLRAACPDIEPIVFVPGTRVADTDISRIRIGCLSPDLWPDSSASFMRVVLDATGLEWFHTCSAGTDHPVFGMIRQRARLTTSSGASAAAIAQHVVTMLVSLRRDHAGFARDQAARVWRPRDVGDVEGTVVAVVGMGPIGSETARLATAFGMRPIGVRRSVTGDEPCETWTFDRLDDLLAIADAVVLAVPLTHDTRHLLDNARIARMRPGTHLVNVGRGDLVDERALVEALRSGHVGAAALDVTATEPLPDDSPLWAMPNVLITPHSSGATASTHHRALDVFVENLSRFMTGRPLHNELP